MEKKIKIDKMKEFVNIDKKKHEIMMKFLDLEHPGPSEKFSGVIEVINIENIWQK